MEEIKEKVQYLVRKLYESRWNIYQGKDYRDDRIPQTLEELSELGQPAFDYLISILNDNLDIEYLLKPVREPDYPTSDIFHLPRIYQPDELTVTITIIKMLRVFGELLVPPLRSYLQSHEDADESVRFEIYREFTRLGEVAYPALVLAIEDPNADLILDILYFFETNKYPYDLSDGYEYPKINREKLSEGIINELILRSSNWPDHYFNSNITVKTLQLLIQSNPRLKRKIQSQLCEIAYQQEGATRERAIDVARGLDATGFANIVEKKAKSNREAADKIMGWLGGNEAVAYFLRRTDESIVGTAQGKNKAIQELFWRMDSFFDKEELETFCFLLDIEYENLRGETKQAKIRELLKSAKRTNQIDEIVLQAKLIRPKADWPNLSEE